MSQFEQSSFQVFNRLKCLGATTVDKTDTEQSRTSKVQKRGRHRTGNRRSNMEEAGPRHQRAGVAGKEALRGRAYGKTLVCSILSLGNLPPAVWQMCESIIQESYAVYRKLTLKMEAITNYEKNNYGSIKHNHSTLIGPGVWDPCCHYKKSINAIEPWEAGPMSRNPAWDPEYFRFQNFQDLEISVQTWPNLRSKVTWGMGKFRFQARDALPVWAFA